MLLHNIIINNYRKKGYKGLNNKKKRRPSQAVSSKNEN